MGGAVRVADHPLLAARREVVALDGCAGEVEGAAAVPQVDTGGSVIKGSAGRDALGDWLRRTVGLDGELGWEQVPGGLSNLTYVVTDERGRRVVVRRPPDGQLTGGALDVLREPRIYVGTAPDCRAGAAGARRLRDNAARQRALLRDGTRAR
jgi:hypothetical protein